jgi:hypothetical protein
MNAQQRETQTIEPSPTPAAPTFRTHPLARSPLRAPLSAGLRKFTRSQPLFKVSFESDGL